MDTGREPSAPTRRAPRPPAHASPLPLILARTSLAFADSVEVFLGGTGQESTPDHYPAAHRAPNPGQGLFPPESRPSVRTPAPQLPGAGPTPFSRSRLPRPRAFPAHPSRRRRLRLQTAQLPPPAWGAQKSERASEGGGGEGWNILLLLSAHPKSRQWCPGAGRGGGRALLESGGVPGVEWDRKNPDTTEKEAPE